MVCDGCNNRLDDADTLRIWGMPKHGEHTSGQQVALYLILTVVRTQSVSMSFYCSFLLQNCGFWMNTEAAEGLGYRSGDVVKLSGMETQRRGRAEGKTRSDAGPYIAVDMQLSTFCLLQTPMGPRTAFSSD